MSPARIALSWRDMALPCPSTHRAQRHSLFRHSVIRASSFAPVIYVSITLSIIAFLSASTPAQAGALLTRAETLRIAVAYCNYAWQATDKNALQGRDIDGVEVHTPNNPATPDSNTTPDPNLWTIDTINTGMPYKWGGFDSLETFEAGLKKGKAAGDIYSPEKRRLGGAAVSSNAVGIDCSGFISRCWKLPTKQSTNSLPSICTKLTSPADLKPGDIMDGVGGHVILFAKWLDDQKTHAQFYESSPFSKVIASTYEITVLTGRGFLPFRYKSIHD